MRAAALLSLTLPARDPAASLTWWADTFGLQPHENVEGALDLGDLAVCFGERLAVKVVSLDGSDLPQQLVDAAGTEVEVVAPDRAAAQVAEQTVGAFIEAAEGLAGPPVESLADAVASVVEAAAQQIATLMAGVAHNKVLATQFTLSRRGQAMAGTERAWPLFAASTLMSGLVITGADPDGSRN